MSWFIEVPGEYADDHRLVVAAVKAGARDLGLPSCPPVRWFMLASAKTAAGWTLGDTFEHEERPLLVGKADHFPPAVWIRAGQSREQTLQTAGHELRHLVQMPGRHDEAEAERYGRKFAAEFESRPAGTKSLSWLPSAEFDRHGNLTAVVPLDRSSQSLTDLGLDFRRDEHPFLATGWGLKAEPVGQLIDAASSDGELWFKAQLAKSHAYRAYIRGLIEQGAVDLRPDVRATAASLARAVVAVTAMPAAA